MTRSEYSKHYYQQNREKKLNWQKAYYYENRERLLGKAKAARITGRPQRRSENKRQENRRRLIEYKRVNGCSTCSERDHRCLDFHHLNPAEKSYCIGNYGHRKWESVLREVGKCVLLCANCRRKLHYPGEDE